LTISSRSNAIQDPAQAAASDPTRRIIVREKHPHDAHIALDDLVQEAQDPKESVAAKPTYAIR